MKYIKGNLLDIEKGILVHQVNTLGIMGAGIALQIKRKWPILYDGYKEICEKNLFKIGDVWFYTEDLRINPDLVIANLFGQKYLGKGATIIDAYHLALPEIQKYSDKIRLPIYFPYKIGCGLAGGDWNVVSNLIEKYCPDVTIVEYIP